MYVIGKCRKCEEIVVFDIGDKTIEESKELMKKAEMGECPGFHVEIGSWADYYNFDWDNLYINESDAIQAKNLIFEQNSLEVI